MDLNNKKPTAEELAQRLATLEFRVSKLDRLVYKLVEQVKRLIGRDLVTGTRD